MSGRNVIVVGYGVTGRSVARALLAAGDEVAVFDDNPAQGAAARTVAVERTPSGSALDERIAAADLVVPSPGVPVGHPVYAAAERASVPVRAEIELADQIRRSSGGPALIAITGTNGKTTVTTLVTAILNASGIEAVAAGNIGVPLIDAVGSGARWAVVEASSFQLQFTETFHPAVSCWLNLTADHLDWHPTLDHYAAAKARIWANQGDGDTAVVCADDPAVMVAARSVPSGVRLVDFSIRGPAAYMLRDDRLLGPDDVELTRLGSLQRALPHDVSNALAACAVATSAGATVDGCREALAAAMPLPHRVSLVGESDGVSWFDDSKATTPAAVLAAVAGFPSVVLIAGGRNKGLDLGPLAGSVPPVHAVVAIGEAAGEVGRAFEGLVPVSTAASMEHAVDSASAAAKEGDAVLLSPGCASFDWYSSYAARGDDFASIVKQRLEKKGDRC